MRELLDQIRSGELAVGTRLPTEPELCAKFGVGRHTLREAVRGLVELGVVERRPRLGTRVVASEPTSHYQIVPNTGADVVSNMQATWMLNPTGSHVVADAELASQLGCEVGDRWYRLAGPRVLRDGSETPLCFSEEYVPDNAKARRSVAKAVRPLPNAADSSIEQEIRAEQINVEAAKALAERRGAPALVVVRRYRDSTGKLVAVMRHSHPASRFSIQMVLPEGVGQ